MLPKSVKNKLRENIKWCYEDVFSEEKKTFIVTEKDRSFFQEKLGVENKNSSFVDFYTVVAIPMVGNGDELYTLEKIMSLMDENEFSELEGMADYIQISSIEGGGSYFYNRKTDQVFDVTWGEEELLAAGKVDSKFDSFSDFLEWYYQ